jgi:hypothetical protein
MKQAIDRLCKFFQVDGDIFRPLSNRTILTWAAQVGPGYQTTREQHAFLIGEVQTF